MEYLKHLIVRTPLEGVSKRVRGLLELSRKVRNPELAELYAEADLVDSIVRRLVARTDNCVDVGCHLGSMLSLFCRLAPEGRHVAFEALPHKARWLRAKFPDVEIHQLALSDAEGEAVFHYNRSRSGFSGLKRHGQPGDSVETLWVKTKRLDDVLNGGPRVHFLKVDVEGCELSVLRGAERILTSDRPHVLFESTQTGLRASDTTTTQVHEFFAGLGYQIYTPRRFAERAAPLVADEFEAAHQYPFAAFNFVAAPVQESRTIRHVATPAEAAAVLEHAQAGDSGTGVA